MPLLTALVFSSHQHAVVYIVFYTPEKTSLFFKQHLTFIIISHLHPELLPVLGQQTFNKIMFNFLGVEHLVNDNGTLVFPRVGSS